MPNGVGGFFFVPRLLMSLYMAPLRTPRVIRAYTLPVELFDHLKGYQRHLQSKADRTSGKPAQEGDDHWITNSQALATIVGQHVQLAFAGGMTGMLIEDFAAAFYMGDLIATPKAIAA